MKGKMSILLSLTLIFLFGLVGISFAVDKEEFIKEYTETYNELLKTDPEVASAFKEEAVEGVRTGEIDLTGTEEAKPEAEATDALKDVVDALAKGDATTLESKQQEALGEVRVEADKLIKAGLSEADVKALETAMKEGNWKEAEKIFEKMDHEKFMKEIGGEYREFAELGRPEFGRGDYDMSTEEGRQKALAEFDKEAGRLKEQGFTETEIESMREAMAKGDFEGAREIGETRYREMDVREMEAAFRESAGREPTEYEKEMMREHERGEFERPEFERFERERETQEWSDRAGGGADRFGGEVWDRPQPQPQPQP